MIQRRTLIGAIGAVALSSASYFPMTACAAMPRGEGSDPIRIVVPYPPGGPLDVSARTIAEAVVDTLGNVIVDNRPGAGGGVGMGFSQHAGLVIVADGTEAAARRLDRVLWNDPASGVMRHADAGYDAAIRCAYEHALDLPGILNNNKT